MYAESSLLFLLLAVNLVRIFAQERVSVDVYYEALCTDSKHFINQQLFPVITADFHDNVNLTFYPYGKTKYHIDPLTNRYIFKCMNEEVCVGNVLHACALKLIDSGKDTPGYGYNNKTLALVNCLMANATTDKRVAKYPLDECAKKSRVEIAADIDECAKGQKGEDFLFSYSYPSEKMNLNSIPLVVFNKRENAELNEAALSDFKATLCEQFQEKPPACAGTTIGLPQTVCVLVAALHLLRRTAF